MASAEPVAAFTDERFEAPLYQEGWREATGCVLALLIESMEALHVKLWYDPGLRRLARELRNHSTVSEILLWQKLKGGQRCGFDFHRQKPVNRYIVDFFANNLMLAVEIDGCSHKLKGPEDDARQGALEALGIRFLRFYDREVRSNVDGVVLAIDGWIVVNRPSTKTPQPTHPALPGTPLDRGDLSSED